MEKKLIPAPFTTVILVIRAVVIAVAVIIGCVLFAVPVSYQLGAAKSPNHIVSVGPSTFQKLFAYANARGITVSEAVTIMVDGYSQNIPAFVGYLRPANYDTLSCESQKAVLQDELENSLLWISKVNNP